MSWREHPVQIDPLHHQRQGRGADVGRGNIKLLDRDTPRAIFTGQLDDRVPGKERCVKLRLEHPEAQILAGGTDILVQMREGKRAGKELISIYGRIGAGDAVAGVAADGPGVADLGSAHHVHRLAQNVDIFLDNGVLGDMAEAGQGANADVLLFVQGHA